MLMTPHIVLGGYQLFRFSGDFTIEGWFSRNPEMKGNHLVGLLLCFASVQFKVVITHVQNELFHVGSSDMNMSVVMKNSTTLTCELDLESRQRTQKKALTKESTVSRSPTAASSAPRASSSRRIVRRSRSRRGGGASLRGPLIPGESVEKTVKNTPNRFEADIPRDSVPGLRDWVHISVVYRAASCQLTFFANGVNIGSLKSPVPLSTLMNDEKAVSSGLWRVGGSPFLQYSSTLCDVAEIRLWECARDEALVKRARLATIPEFLRSQLAPSVLDDAGKAADEEDWDDLVGYWKCYGSSNRILEDCSGLQHHAVVFGQFNWTSFAAYRSAPPALTESSQPSDQEPAEADNGISESKCEAAKCTLVVPFQAHAATLKRSVWVSTGAYLSCQNLNCVNDLQIGEVARLTTFSTVTGKIVRDSFINSLNVGLGLAAYALSPTAYIIASCM